MDIQKLLLAILRGWWIILSFALISAGAGLAYSYQQQPVFEVSTSFVLTTSSTIKGSYDRLFSMNTLAGRTALPTTYSELLQSHMLVEKAAARLEIPTSMVRPYKRSCVALPDAFVLELHIEGPSPYLAADLANEIGVVGIEYVQSLQEIYELRQVDKAVPNPEPIEPDHFQNMVMSTIIGVAGGFGFSILREVLMQFLGGYHASKKKDKEEEEGERDADTITVPRPIP